MDDDPKIIVWFPQIGKGDIACVGGKGANLGELTRFGIPVPSGFIVTADAYYYFLRESGLSGKIEQLLQPLDPGNGGQLGRIASQIKNVIIATPMPVHIVEEIKQAYRTLGEGLVAVRSSATAEDLPEASFAGQQSTFLNVEGEDAVVRSVQGCWASLFEPRAIFYRNQHGFDQLQIGIAVPVQRMVQSETSGVMFTVEPLTNDDTKILIESVFGLGEAVVSGEVTPDLYVVDKQEMQIIERHVSKQEWQLVRNHSAGGTGSNVKSPIPSSKQGIQKIRDDEIIALAKLGKQIEEAYGFPQDVEWAQANEELFIVQARPVTTLSMAKTVGALSRIRATVLLSGLAASPGMASGRVRVVHDVTQLDEVEKGDILVTEMTTPDFVPAMKRVVGIVTDRGGRTAHAAIVSRELGIPCVVATERATKVLNDGRLVTVDGFRGNIYEGRVLERIEAPANIAKGEVCTRTKLYVNLAEPELAEGIAARDVDGVGLLRAEFMIAQIGEHPRYMLSQNRGEEFVTELANGITAFAKAFNPRPVVYRTTDFKTNEYRNLRGGQEYEELEENPMIGYRGCSRYTRELDVFRLELEALKRVRKQYKNVWIMIPFVRTVQEIVETKRILETEGLAQSPDFKLWMMVEVPSNILLIDKFIDAGIDGISIGSNDLTQLILGIDRDSPRLVKEFDEMNEAVLIALERAVKAAVRRGITASICGQAPSVYPELTEKLVEWGITSVSVSPDMIDQTREIIAAAEARVTDSTSFKY